MYKYTMLIYEMKLNKNEIYWSKIIIVGTIVANKALLKKIIL